MLGSSNSHVKSPATGGNQTHDLLAMTPVIIKPSCQLAQATCTNGPPSLVIPTLVPTSLPEVRLVFESSLVLFVRGIPSPGPSNR